MQGLLPSGAQVRTFLEQFTTPEARLAVSGLLLVVAGLLAWLVLPTLVSRADRLISERVLRGRAADVAETVGEYAPGSISGIILRSTQLAIVVATGVAVLFVWGLAGYVADGTQYLLAQRVLIGKAVGSVLVFLGAYVGARFLADSVDDLSSQTEWMTEHQEEIVLRISQLALFTIGGMVFLSVWGLDLGSLLVGAGFLGIVIGFAARQTLGSLIAGFVLMFSRPFTIGDWVQIADQEGIVTDITIFNTRLENFDGEFVIIPNDSVSNQPVTNRSQKGLLRLRVDVGIDYEADPDHAMDVAIEAINELDAVVDAPPPQVFPKSFGDSAVVMEMRFWIDHPTPPRKWRAISQVIQTVKESFEAEGIKIPFPQRELSGRAETGGFRVHDAETGDGHRADAEPAEHD